MSYLIRYTGDGVEAAVAPGQFVYWKSGETRWVTKEVSEFYTSRPTLFEVLTTDATVDDRIENYLSTVNDAGRMAFAYVDFNTGAAEAETVITVGSRDFVEADTAVVATGVWTNGADAAASATSFAAAVNGDARNGGSPFTAVVAANDEGVWLFADIVGENYNVAITTDSAARVTVPTDEEFVGGADAARQKVCAFQHIVTTQDLLATALEIPLPFVPTAWFIDAYSATGAKILFTDLVTLVETPDRLVITPDGITNLANTNVLHILLIGE